MSVDSVAARSPTRTYRAGMGWLLLTTVSRAYLCFLGTLVACAALGMLTGLSAAVVQSGSMEPHISIGDMVLSQARSADDPPPMGMVVTFRAPVGSAKNGLVVHRVVAANKDGSLVTAGDANADVDSTPLDRHNIISQARLLVPWIGLPAFWVKTGAFLALGIWVLLTMGALMIGAVRAASRQQPAKRPPANPGRPSGSGPDPEPGTATQATRPHGKSSPSLVKRIRSVSGPAASALVALLTALALAAAPLALAGAAFSAQTSTRGNAWGTAGPATKLAFTTNPSSSTGGTAFGTQPVVAVQDAGGSTVGLSSAPVTLTITTPAGATLTCTANPTNAVEGVATFTGCGIDDAGTYTLTAAASGLANAVSASFAITLGSATRLAFTTSPSSSTGGVAFASQPVVTVQDAGGNSVTTSIAPVTLTITTPAGATLTCTANPTASVAGVATFAGCGVDDPGTYTLTAASSGLANAVSASFAITLGSATKLAFTTSPSSSTGGVAFASQPVVTVQDAGGNTVTTSIAPVTLTITTPAGATLACTTNPANAVAGVATFAGCSISLKTGTYTLTAASSGLTNAVSSSFAITVGPATKLAFTTSPSISTAISTNFVAQPKVTIQDAGGNTVTTSTASITLTITTPAGATLACTANPKAAVAGVDTFAACKIDTAGTYTLTATSTGLTNAISASFTIFGPATKLAFTTSPSISTAINTNFVAQPKVTIQDAGGNTVTTSTASVTLAITTPAGATLTCTAKTKAAVAGVDTFAACKIDTAGIYTLTATSSGLTDAISASFTIFGPATQLAFTTSPSSSTGGIAFTNQPVVTVQDAGGNTVTTSTASITLTITTPAGATLACTANPKAAVAGVDIFAACKINKVGTYTLTAASGTLTAAVSNSFTITAGPATKLAFTTSPSSSTGGIAFTTQPVVTVQDASGNTVTTSTASITLTITTPAGATLACATNPTSAVAGVAAFTGCNISLKTGTYTLTAASSGLTNAVSASFAISVGPATKLAFTTSPSNSTVNAVFTTQPSVTVQDAGGNTVTTSTASVTLTITTLAGATLTCTANPKAAVAGVDTFTACKINTAGTYTLTATSGTLAAAVSNSFTIN